MTRRTSTVIRINTQLIRHSQTSFRGTFIILFFIFCYRCADVTDLGMCAHRDVSSFNANTQAKHFSSSVVFVVLHSVCDFRFCGQASHFFFIFLSSVGFGFGLCFLSNSGFGLGFGQHSPLFIYQ